MVFFYHDFIDLQSSCCWNIAKIMKYRVHFSWIYVLSTIFTRHGKEYIMKCFLLHETFKNLSKIQATPSRNFWKTNFQKISWKSLREKCPDSKLLWSVFSRIWTEYGEILRISPDSVWMRENTHQNNLHTNITLFTKPISTR